MTTVGVVGLGYWGPNLARNFNALEDCELRWCCDVSEAARERWSKAFPFTRFSADIDELDFEPGVVKLFTVTSNAVFAAAALRFFERWQNNAAA